MTLRSPISGKEQKILVNLSSDGLVTSLVFSYAELRDNGAPCAVYFNGNPEKAEDFYDLMRRIHSYINTPENRHTFHSGIGNDPNAGFDAFRPESFLPTGLGFINILQGHSAISKPDAERAKREFSEAMANIDTTATPVLAGGSQVAHLRNDP